MFNVVLKFLLLVQCNSSHCVTVLLRSLGVADDTRSEVSHFFSAVTVVFRGGCLAWLEDFSVVLLDYGL